MEKIPRLIIAGGRDFKDYNLLKLKTLEFIINEIRRKDIEIVSGTAQGADVLGEYFAKEYNLPVKRFPAEWKKHGKAAGPIRNEEMAKYADYCIVFWNGESKGTKNMIDNCEKYVLNHKIIRYE